MANLALGVTALEKTCCTNNNINQKQNRYKIWIWILTYLTYAMYHMSRRPISIVKTVLNENCTEEHHDDPPSNHDNNTHWCDWAPFDDDDSQSLLGIIDSCFLFAYAFGMFFCGIIAERMDLRYFLTIGMVLSGAFTIMFGLGHAMKIHMFWFYALAMVLNGLVQCSGWPSVVAVMGNWFGKSKRGLIMGVWNSHTSVGNIIGALIAGAFVTNEWTWSFAVPGILIATVGAIVFFFLVPEPSHLNLPSATQVKDRSLLPHSSTYPVEASPDETENLLQDEDSEGSSYGSGDKPSDPEATVDIQSQILEPQHSSDRAIGFFDALKIPGVIEFSLCLFFAKLVSYTFLYWLPQYLKYETSFDSTESANLSTLFDVGGVIGGIMAGIISDASNKPASTCSIMLVFAIPMLYVYNTYGSTSLGLNIFMLMMSGLLVNGPYSLITTAVSAELGTHESLKGNSKALATVSSIIDGTGSIGAAVGPLIAGPISAAGWSYVFYMLMGADILALLLLTRLVYHELRSSCSR